MEPKTFFLYISVQILLLRLTSSFTNIRNKNVNRFYLVTTNKLRGGKLQVSWKVKI